MTTRASHFIFFVCGLLLAACAPKQAMERDQQIIDELVVQHKDQIELCYEQARTRNQHLGSGRLHLRADHLPDGRLSNVRALQSFPGSHSLVRCLEGLIASWETERPVTRGPVDIIWDFQSKPNRP